MTTHNTRIILYLHHRCGGVLLLLLLLYCTTYLSYSPLGVHIMNIGWSRTAAAGVPLLRMCLVRLPDWPGRPLFLLLLLSSFICSLHLYISLVCTCILIYYFVYIRSECVEYYYMLLFSDIIYKVYLTYTYIYILYILYIGTKYKVKHTN